MPNYHLVLEGDEERNIRGDHIHIGTTGALELYRGEKGQPAAVGPVVAYAPGQWRMVEVESQDRG